MQDYPYRTGRCVDDRIPLQKRREEVQQIYQSHRCCRDEPFTGFLVRTLRSEDWMKDWFVDMMLYISALLLITTRRVEKMHSQRIQFLRNMNSQFIDYTYPMFNYFLKSLVEWHRSLWKVKQKFDRSALALT